MLATARKLGRSPMATQPLAATLLLALLVYSGLCAVSADSSPQEPAASPASLSEQTAEFYSFDVLAEEPDDGPAQEEYAKKEAYAYELCPDPQPADSIKQGGTPAGRMLQQTHSVFCSMHRVPLTCRKLHADTLTPTIAYRAVCGGGSLTC